jgi:hypothetical protein
MSLPAFNHSHQWTANDIDALAIAVPCCDAVFTSKAGTQRAASRELRPFATFLPP